MNEFVMKSHIDLDELMARCVAQGILPGVKIAPDEILIAVTEMCSRKDMDRLTEIIAGM